MKRVITITIIGILLVVSSLALGRFFRRRTTSYVTPMPDNSVSVRETFAVLGDTGTGGEAQKQVGALVADYCNTVACEGVFVAGDVIYERGVSRLDDEQFQTKFEVPYKEIRAPFYLAFGNHDYLGCVDCYYAYSNRSDKWHMPERYYQQEFDTVLFYVIDTNNFDTTQQDWLTRRLAAADDRWKIVVGHHPLEAYDVVHAGEHWNGRDALKKIICNQADLYISGHSHLLMDVGVIDGCGVRQLISGAGGAHLYDVLTVVPVESHYTDYGFLFLDIKPNELRYGFHLVDQRDVYSYRIVQ